MSTEIDALRAKLAAATERAENESAIAVAAQETERRALMRAASAERDRDTAIANLKLENARAEEHRVRAEEAERNAESFEKLHHDDMTLVRTALVKAGCRIAGPQDGYMLAGKIDALNTKLQEAERRLAEVRREGLNLAADLVRLGKPDHWKNHDRDDDGEGGVDCVPREQVVVIALLLRDAIDRARSTEATPASASDNPFGVKCRDCGLGYGHTWPSDPRVSLRSDSNFYCNDCWKKRASASDKTSEATSPNRAGQPGASQDGGVVHADNSPSRAEAPQEPGTSSADAGEDKLCPGCGKKLGSVGHLYSACGWDKERKADAGEDDATRARMIVLSLADPAQRREALDGLLIIERAKAKEERTREIVQMLRAVPEPKGPTPYEPGEEWTDYWAAQKFADAIEARWGRKT